MSDESWEMEDSQGEGNWSVNKVKVKDTFYKNALEISKSEMDYLKHIVVSFRKEGHLPKWIKDYTNEYEYEQFIDMLQSNIDSGIREHEDGKEESALLMDLCTAVMWNRMIIIKMFNVLRELRGDDMDKPYGKYAEEDW